MILGGLLGCADNTLSSEEKRTKIEVVVKKKDASFWSVVRLGAEAAGKEFDVDVKFDGPVNEKDIEEQIKIVDAAINEKVDAIVLAASDYTKLIDVVERADAQKIPVVIIDSELNSNKIKAFVGTDNIDAGNKLGQTLVEKLGKSCKIAVMSFIKGAATSDQREQGVFQELNKYPNIKVVSTLYSSSDENIAYGLTKTLIKENPDLDAIVCTNAYGTVGTARAVEEEGKAGSIKIIGFDSTPEEISFVEKGVIDALVVQNPFNMGYLGVKYALDSIKKKAVPQYTNTESTYIDKNNMYQPENEKLVFPFTN
jgi:ribose transport system substrate-binding protein